MASESVYVCVCVCTCAHAYMSSMCICDCLCEMGIWVWHTSRARLTWDLLGQAEERNADPNFLRQVVLQESLRKKTNKNKRKGYSRGTCTVGTCEGWFFRVSCVALHGPDGPPCGSTASHPGLPLISASPKVRPSCSREVGNSQEQRMAAWPLLRAKGPS